jgi:hypothetical protein
MSVSPSSPPPPTLTLTSTHCGLSAAQRELTRHVRVVPFIWFS